MLDQDVLPTLGQNHLMQREHMSRRHAQMLENILIKNLNKDKYWVLGWVECKRKDGKTRITPKMQALYQKPEVTKETYLYEVDNIAGTKTLLWVMHPNNKLSLPSLGKSIHVAGETGV